MKRGVLTLILFVLLLIGFYWLNRIIPTDTNILGMHQRVSGHSNIFLYQANKQFQMGALAGTGMHEAAHALHRMGYMDYDVPHAAALGYYLEWKIQKKLSDESKYRVFLQGFDDLQPALQIERLVDKYKDISPEDKESYEDAALLAGLVAQTFRDEPDIGTKYIFCLTMSVNPHAALTLARSDAAYRMLLGLRRGSYTIFNGMQFTVDLSGIEESDNQHTIIDYKNHMLADFDVLYVKRNRLQ